MVPGLADRWLLVSLLVMGSVSSAFAWQLLIGDFEAETLAVDAAGDPVVGGGRVTKLRAEDGTARWIWDVGVTHELRLDAGGDVYVAAQTQASVYPWQSQFLVARLAGASGAELWRHQVTGGFGGQEAARRVVVDGAGDVIAGGVLSDGAEYGYHVVKLSGATGAELWHVDGAGDELLALAVDAANDVIFSHGAPFSTGSITKLSGADGSVVWTHGPEASVAYAMAVDAAGDLLTADARGTLVAKRSGTDGSVVWTQPAAGGVALALDSSGDVVTVGIAAFGGAASVWKLSGLTGAVLWEVHDGLSYGVFNAVTFDAAGQIVVAGAPTSRFGLYTYTSMTAVVLSSADGAEVWGKEFHVDRGSLAVNEALAVGVAAGGRVVMAGGFGESNAVGSVQFGVVSVGGPSAGKRLLVQDGAAAPSARRLVFSATGPELLVGAPGGAGSPLFGATVELFNPVTGETATTSLPALGWKPLGSDTYVYSDGSQLLGPCTRAKLKGRRDATFGTRLGGLSLACKGALLGFTLDEPTQGALGVRFRVGPIEQCFVLGGTVTRDRPATPTRTGLFQAKDAPAPVTCP